MKQTLKSFHFDPIKSGQILNRYVKTAGFSSQKAADEVGYTYDIINNILHGKNKELQLERAFKICVLTGHSVCEYLREMLQDVDIDFADKIHVLRDVEMALVPYTETIVATTNTSVSETNRDTKLVQTHVFDQNSPEVQAVYRAVMEQATIVHQANVERIKNIYDKSISDQEKAHDKHVETVTKVARQRLRWIIILAVILMAIIVWFIWDLTHPEIGLIRLKQMGYISQHIIGKALSAFTHF